jgi:hypothetical protein
MAPTFCFTQPIESPILPDPVEIDTSVRDIIGDLRRLCKMEERYLLHVETLNHIHADDQLVTRPPMAYLLRPKSRAIRILPQGSDECNSCLAHQGIR